MSFESANDQPSSHDKITPAPTTFLFTDPAFTTLLEEALNADGYYSVLPRAILHGQEPYASQAARVDASLHGAREQTRGQSQGGINRANNIEAEVHKVWQRDAEKLWSAGHALWGGKPSASQAGKILSKKYRAALRTATDQEKETFKKLCRTADHIRKSIQKPA